MLIDIPYQRDRAVEYARRWALSRNPLFPDFAGSGGDCTNFISQCVLAGSGVMNYTPTFGWYYLSIDNRAPAWSGVDEFYDFMVGAPQFVEANGGTGPRAYEIRNATEIEIGDVIQLANSSGSFYHTLIISDFKDNDILVCAHTNDALDRPLSSYDYASLRILHVERVILNFKVDEFYQGLLNGDVQMT
jgi:hypothetical protein